MQEGVGQITPRKKKETRKIKKMIIMELLKMRIGFQKTKQCIHNNKCDFAYTPLYGNENFCNLLTKYSVIKNVAAEKQTKKNQARCEAGGEHHPARTQ